MALVVLAACDPPPPPTVLVVDALGAGADADPGDGVCEAVGGGCTLQAAADEASASHVDRIDVPAGWTIPATSTYVVDPVAPTLTIASTTPGSPVTVLGGFDVASGAVLLSDVALTGSAAGAVHVGPGAAVVLNRTRIEGRSGTAVEVTTDDLTTHVVLVDSTIEGGSGAAVAASGWSTVLRVVRSTIAGNAGPAADLSEYGQVTVIDSEVLGNGGGISGADTEISVSGSTFADNAGSAVSTTFEPVVIEDSTITGSATAVAVDSNDVVVRRSTIAGNDVGIRADWSTTAEVTASTFANGTDLVAAGDAELTVAGSILGGDTACEDLDGFAWFASEGHNVVADSSCGFTGTGDQQGVDPLLGTLGDNGGPTPTIVPDAGSPAVDVIPVGTPGLCEAGTVDQRGLPRPQGPACDAGAVEQ